MPAGSWLLTPASERCSVLNRVGTVLAVVWAGERVSKSCFHSKSSTQMRQSLMDRANQIHACVSRSWKLHSAITPNVFGAIVNLFVTKERSSGVFSSRRPRRDGGTMGRGYATVLHMQDQRRNMQMQKSANE